MKLETINDISFIFYDEEENEKYGLSEITLSRVLFNGKIDDVNFDIVKDYINKEDYSYLFSNLFIGDKNFCIILNERKKTNDD
jgi:hypothetical protein